MTQEKEDLDVGTTTNQDVQDAPAPENAPTELDALTKALAEAQEKANKNWDMLLRKEAENQNIRKQALLDIEKTNKFALEKFAGELVAVLHSFEQGLKSISLTTKEEQGHYEGMRLTYKQLLDILSKFGVKEINPVGVPFNPQEHEALSQIPTDDVPAGHVFEVIQKGYSLNGRLLQAARVLVAQQKS